MGRLRGAILQTACDEVGEQRPMPDGSVKILSDNDRVPPEIAVDGEMHVIGRVVAVIRKV